MEQLNLHPARIASACGQQAVQAVLNGQRHLHPACPTTDHADSEHPGAVEHAPLQILPALQPGIDGLDRHHVLQRTLHACSLWARSHVDREQVEIHRRSPGDQHLTIVEIQALRRGVVEPCTGETRQRPQVDMAVVVAVVTGDQARKHAGVWRVDIASDQGQADTRQRIHTKAAQYCNVRMATTDQDHILDDRHL